MLCLGQIFRTPAMRQLSPLPLLRAGAEVGRRGADVQSCRLGVGSEVRSLKGTSDVPVQSGIAAHIWNVPKADACSQLALVVSKAIDSEAQPVGRAAECCNLMLNKQFKPCADYPLDLVAGRNRHGMDRKEAP